MKTKPTLLILALAVAQSHAAITANLPGNTEQILWTGLSSFNYNTGNGYPNSGNTDPWGPILSDTGGLTFEKVSGPAYFINGGAGIYGNFMGSGSVYLIGDASPLGGMETVIFQARLGQAVSVSLDYNGGGQALAADYFAVTPTGGPAGEDHAWQWDLSGIAEPITSYEIRIEAPLHTFIYADMPLTLDAGDSFAQVVPEPSSLMFAALGAFAFTRRRRG